MRPHPPARAAHQAQAREQDAHEDERRGHRERELRVPQCARDRGVHASHPRVELLHGDAALQPHAARPRVTAGAHIRECISPCARGPTRHVHKWQRGRAHGNAYRHARAHGNAYRHARRTRECISPRARLQQQAVVARVVHVRRTARVRVHERQPRADNAVLAAGIGSGHHLRIRAAVIATGSDSGRPSTSQQGICILESRRPVTRRRNKTARLDCGWPGADYLVACA